MACCFEILQNTVLDANRWENNLAGKGRAPFKQNQFGGAAGGPIIKNKLFIFGDYQGTRIATAGGVIQNLGYGGFYTIPTQAMTHGDFSQSARTADWHGRHRASDSAEPDLRSPLAPKSAPMAISFAIHSQAT